MKGPIVGRHRYAMKMLCLGLYSYELALTNNRKVKCDQDTSTSIQFVHPINQYFKNISFAFLKFYTLAALNQIHLIHYRLLLQVLHYVVITFRHELRKIIT